MLIPSSLFGAKVSNYSIPAEVDRAGPLRCVVNHANEPSFGHGKHFRRLILSCNFFPWLRHCCQCDTINIFSVLYTFHIGNVASKMARAVLVPRLAQMALL